MKRFTSCAVLLLLSVMLTATGRGQVPTITNFSPTSGPVGTSVTITGTRMDLVISVAFGSTDQPVFSETSTTVTATVPSGAITGPIHLGYNGGTVTSSSNFTVTAPPAPTIEPASNVTSTSFQANWDPVTGGLDHYVLDVSTDTTFQGGFVGVYHNAYIGPNYELVSNLTASNVYFYRVRAVGQHNDTSGYSDVARVLTFDAPVAMAATGITSTGFTAHWTTVTGATGYVIDVVTRSSFGGETHVTGYYDFPVGTGTSYAVTNLLPDTTYYYRVRATSAKGEGPSSNTITVPRVTTASPLASITIGVPYSKPFAGEGGTAPYTWSLVGGSTPTGTNFSAAGVLSGIPTALGTFNFTVQMTDQASSTVTRSYSLPVISTTTIRFDTATAGNIYGSSGSTVSWQHTVSNGTNRMLVVTVGGEDPSAAVLAAVTVTYNGVALTKATGGSTTYAGRTNIGQIWYMRESTLPAPGEYTLTVSAGSTVAGLGGVALSLSNVSQGAPDAAVSVADSLSKNLTALITTHTDHAWLISGAVNGWSGNFYPVANQESRLNMSGEFDLLASTKEVPAAGADSMLARHLVLYRMVHPVISLAPASSGVNATAKVYLQGPYNTANNTMNNSLRTGGQLASHFGSMPIPFGAVDSINIEIRDSAAASKATKRAFAPAWLMTDGTVRGFGDTTKTYVGFNSVAPGSYYIVISHRNHLSVMSKTAVSLTGGTSPVAYDFSTGQGQAYGNNPLRAAGTRFAMPGGDGNGDGGVDAFDRNLVWRVQNGTNGYLGGDFNLDGGADAFDVNLIWLPDNGTATQVP